MIKLSEQERARVARVQEELEDDAQVAGDILLEHYQKVTSTPQHHS